MPCQIITIRLDGLTAGDYLAHLCDPDPAAGGLGLLSVDVRAEPLGDVVEASLVWAGAVPEASDAAQAAGLPRVAEAVALDAVIVHDLPATADARPRRAPALPERVANRLAVSARPPHVGPLLLRWA